MQKKSISFSQTGQFSKIITDYLNNENVLTPFYTWKQDISEFDAIIPGKAAENIDRKLLTAELHQQYQGLTDNDLVNANILALQDENTFCVVTAHQLNIFGGPLYIVYKTLSVIKLCSTLSEKYPDKKFVPMFWLGSEDHDFEEINHVKVLEKIIPGTMVRKALQGNLIQQAYQLLLMNYLLLLATDLLLMN